MPPGIPYIVGNEAAERFSFYGMKAILTVFMTQYLVDAAGAPDPMGDEAAKGAYHLFTAAAYVAPVLGALLSDVLWGKYRTILYLSVGYCAGHAALALGDTQAGRAALEPRHWLLLGMALIAIGAGGIKPCVSAHVGDQFGARNQHLIPRAFGWFYFSINTGATASFLLTPVLLERYGGAVAFGVPGVLMAAAWVVFWAGRRRFVHVPPSGWHDFWNETLGHEGRRAVRQLLIVFIMLAPFWALFDQTGSSWVLQAEAMDRRFLGIHWLSSQLGAVNPLLVLVLVPFFTYGLYPWLDRFVTVTPLRRIGAGFLFAVAAFAVTAWVQMRLDTGGQPSIAWQLLAYLLLTAGEVLVSVTALEFAYTQAPRRSKSVVMAVYLASIALGNAFTSAVNFLMVDAQGANRLAGAAYFWFFAAVMLLTFLLFIPVARLYRGRAMLQGESSDQVA